MQHSNRIPLRNMYDPPDPNAPIRPRQPEVALAFAGADNPENPLPTYDHNMVEYETPRLSEQIRIQAERTHLSDGQAPRHPRVAISNPPQRVPAHQSTASYPSPRSSSPHKAKRQRASSASSAKTRRPADAPRDPIPLSLFAYPSSGSNPTSHAGAARPSSSSSSARPSSSSSSAATSSHSGASSSPSVVTATAASAQRRRQQPLPPTQQQLSRREDLEEASALDLPRRFVLNEIIRLRRKSDNPPTPLKTTVPKSLEPSYQDLLNSQRLGRARWADVNEVNPTALLAYDPETAEPVDSRATNMWNAWNAHAKLQKMRKAERREGEGRTVSKEEQSQDAAAAVVDYHKLTKTAEGRARLKNLAKNYLEDAADGSSSDREDRPHKAKPTFDTDKWSKKIRETFNRLSNQQSTEGIFLVFPTNPTDRRRPSAIISPGLQIVFDDLDSRKIPRFDVNTCLTSLQGIATGRYFEKYSSGLGFQDLPSRAPAHPSLSSSPAPTQPRASTAQRAVRAAKKGPMASSATVHDQAASFNDLWSTMLNTARIQLYKDCDLHSPPPDLASQHRYDPAKLLVHGIELSIDPEIYYADGTPLTSIPAPSSFNKSTAPTILRALQEGKIQLKPVRNWVVPRAVRTDSVRDADLARISRGEKRPQREDPSDMSSESGAEDMRM